MSNFEHVVPARPDHGNSDVDAVEFVFQNDRINGGDGLYIRADAPDDADVPFIGGWITERSSRALFAALAERYGAAPEPFRPAVGDVVKVLPGARSAVGGVSRMASDVTRAQVDGTADADGDYCVRPLDGRRDGGTYYVLPEYLAPLDEPTPEPTPAPRALVIGQEYRLLPGAKYADGCAAVISRHGATRVRLVRLANHTGNARVKALDGEDAYRVEWGVDPAYLAPLDTWAVGDEAIVTRDRPVCASLYHGDRVTVLDAVTHEDGQEWVRIQFLSGRGSRHPLSTGYVVRLSDIRRPDAPREWAPGDEAIVTADYPWFAELRVGDRVRLTTGVVDDDSRGMKVRAEFVSGRGRPAPFDNGSWHVPADAIRRP